MCVNCGGPFSTWDALLPSPTLSPFLTPAAPSLSPSTPQPSTFLHTHTHSLQRP